jgi:glutathione S-transferase
MSLIPYFTATTMRAKLTAAPADYHFQNAFSLAQMGLAPNHSWRQRQLLAQPNATRFYIRLKGRPAFSREAEQQEM